MLQFPEVKFSKARDVNLQGHDHIVFRVIISKTHIYDSFGIVARQERNNCLGNVVHGTVQDGGAGIVAVLRNTELGVTTPGECHSQCGYFQTTNDSKRFRNLLVLSPEASLLQLDVARDDTLAVVLILRRSVQSRDSTDGASNSADDTTELAAEAVRSGGSR